MSVSDPICHTTMLPPSHCATSALVVAWLMRRISQAIGVEQDRLAAEKKAKEEQESYHEEQRSVRIMHAAHGPTSSVRRQHASES